MAGCVRGSVAADGITRVGRYTYKVYVGFRISIPSLVSLGAPAKEI